MAQVTPQFTAYSYDLLSGAPLGQFPCRGLQCSQQVNQPGTAQFTLDLTDPRVLKANPVALTQPDRTLIVIDYMGALLWGGIVKSRKPARSASESSTSNTLGVQCAELWSWFGGRVQATDYSSPPSSGIAPALNALSAPTGLTATAVVPSGTTAYYWMVTAYNQRGETTGSAEVTLSLDPSAIGPTNHYTGIVAVLQWNAVQGASGYRVYRSTVSGAEVASPAFVGNATGTAFSDTLAQPTTGAVPTTNTTGTGTGMALWPQTPWDAGLIACQVIQDAIGNAQSAAYSNATVLGSALTLIYNGQPPSIVTPQVAASNYVAVTYPYTSTQTVDAIVTQLASLGVNVGFDFALDLAYGSGAGSPIKATVNLSYPRRGLSAAQNNLVCDFTTARGYTFTQDGSQSANQVYEIGGQSAISVSRNANALNQGYPLWERVVSRGQIQSQNIMGILAQTGFSDLATFSYAPVTCQVTLGLFDSNLGLTANGLPFIVGDNTQIVIPQTAGDGQVFDQLFPAGLNQEWRIIQWAADIKDEGDPTLTLTLAQPPLASLPSAPAF